MTRSTLWKGYLCAITSAVLYGCMPLLSKLIYADGINAVTLVLFRNLLALPLLGVLAFVGSKSLRLPKKVLPQISAIAVLGCIITPLLLLASYLFIDSGVATVFHFIYPAVVILLGGAASEAASEQDQSALRVAMPGGCLPVLYPRFQVGLARLRFGSDLRGRLRCVYLPAGCVFP